MKRRSKAQWQSLIQEFEQSGMTQAEYCAQRTINPKYFSLRRAKLKTETDDRSFVQALAPQPAVSATSIQYGRVIIQLHTASAQQIIELAKALA